MITQIIIFLWGHTELLEKSWNSKINYQNLTGQICLTDLMKPWNSSPKQASMRGKRNKEEIKTHNEKLLFIVDVLHYMTSI